MTRNLKVLGLALVAVFAMTAVFASAGQGATKLTCASYPCIITGHPIEHNKTKLHTFTLNTGTSISCTTVTFEGTIAKAADNESVTITPTYDSCSTAAGGPVTVNMNGCDYVFHGGSETVGEPHHFAGGLADLKCPAGGPTVVIFANATDHAANKPACTITVTPENNLSENTYTNTTEPIDDVDVTSTVNTKVTKTGVLCGAAATAVYTGGTTLTAWEDLGGTPPKEGKQINLTVSK